MVEDHHHGQKDFQMVQIVGSLGWLGPLYIVTAFPHDAHPDPKPAWDQLPKENKHTVEPVDGDDGLTTFKGLHDVASYLLDVQLHGKLAAFDERCLDKTRTYV